FAAVDIDRSWTGDPDAAGDRVVAAERVQLQRIVGGLAAFDLHLGGEPGDEHLACVRAEVDVVGVRGPVRDNRVGCSVPAAAGAPRQVDVGLLEFGSAEIVDADRVRATERVHRETLDGVEVHGDRGDVAGQSHS